jgi:hypothetical protein
MVGCNTKLLMTRTDSSYRHDKEWPLRHKSQVDLNTLYYLAYICALINYGIYILSKYLCGAKLLKLIDTHIVAYLLKARTIEPEKQPLLANDSKTTFVFKQRPQKKQDTSRCQAADS